MKPVKNVSTATLGIAASNVPRAGQIIGDRYKLEQPLERGAMGSVWRAEQIRLRAPVALKFLEPSLIGDKEMHDRFMQEARSAAAVRSAHVVQVFDYGSDGGVPYIAMELLDGENLDTRLGRGPLTPQELDKIFGEVARGIGKAHSMGVIHRDLKPGNIFIAREGEHEVTKLVDFGIAKVKADALKFTQNVGTHVGTLLGTPQYMSPEQVRGSSTVDQRTDLWALAIIACECLTGRYPFSGSTIGDLTVQICTEKPTAPSSLGPVPPGFDYWFFKATRKAQNKRFASVEEMATALHKVLAQASTTSNAGAWPGRLINLPSGSSVRSGVRLAYTALATWPGQFFIKLQPVFLSLRESLVRLGAEVTRLAGTVRSRARALAQSEQLAFARPVLARPALAAFVVLSVMVLVGVATRDGEPAEVAQEPKPGAQGGEPALANAAAPADRAPADGRTVADEVVLAALPAPATSAPAVSPKDVPGADPSFAAAATAPALPAPRVREPQPRGTLATQAHRRAKPRAALPGPRPVTPALAKAAEKIMSPVEQAPSKANESASAKVQPANAEPSKAESAPRLTNESSPRSAPSAKRPPNPSQKRAGSGDHPFDDRL